MSTHRIRRAAGTAAAAAALTGLVLGGVVAPASADTRQDATLARLKTRGDAEIARRLTTLDDLSNGIAQAKHITANDKQRLTTIVANDKSGLAALKTKIDADTDVATARVDVQTIVTGFRVYVLVVPQVRLVRASDLGLDATTHLDAVAAKLQAAIDAAKAKGKDVTVAQSAVTDLEAQTKAASGLLTPVPDQVSSLTPAQWPGAHTTLEAARDSLRTARHDLQTARNDVKAAFAALPR